jgi:general secretion pathway protein A
MPHVLFSISFGAWLLWATGTYADMAVPAAQETARLLAMLLDSGREVVKRNQELIDNPRKGNKGFTPDVFERQLVETFYHRSGVDLAGKSNDGLSTKTRELLNALVQAGKAVVSDAQAVINQRGVGYKNFVPATFGSQAAWRFSMKSDVRLKQTTLNPRNLKNQPDAHEEEILHRLTGRSDGSAVSDVVDNGGTLRLLTPIYYSKDCLQCHGEPAGELDISGYPKEGAREGDLAGAISVRIPLHDK